MEAIGLEDITKEVIQAAIAQEKRRQLIERILEELAEESESYEADISQAEMKVAVQIIFTGSAFLAAQNLGLSIRTVHGHMGSFYAKTGLASMGKAQTAVTQKLLEMIDV